MLRPPVLLAAAMLLVSGLPVAGQIPIMTPQRAGPGVQAAADVREPLIRSLCKQAIPRPAPPPNFGSQRPEPNAYTVQAIPGVIAAGQRWVMIWSESGNNADGIIGQADGSVLIAQNDNSDVLRIDPNGHYSVAYTDTNTGGEVTQNKNGELFVTERALVASIWELAPERRMLADAYQGEPLDCRGGTLDSPAALHTGGVYFGDDGLYYADPRGEVTQYGNRVYPNDMVLSADERTLYVASLGKLYAFDVAPDGALSHQRVLAVIPGGGNDGGTIDAAGRIYIGGIAGLRVFAASGRYLGTIPAPFDITGTTFSGPGKKTLFATAAIRRPGGVVSAVLKIQMIAQGYLGRAR